MSNSIQLIYVVMWEPTDPVSTKPFEFRWSRDRSEYALWRAEVLDSDSAAALTVYSAELPVPTDGDFADNMHLEDSLRQILQSWPRNECPPSDQALGGRVRFTRTNRASKS